MTYLIYIYIMKMLINFSYFERIDNMDNSETIKKNIRTINPIFTDELLNLLYEYLFLRHSSECLISLQDIKEDISLKNKISEVTLSAIKK